jgi:hypothetical protein
VSGKPDIRIVMKSKASGQAINLLAGWKRDRGISCRLDRDVVRLVIERADGSREIVTRGQDGKETHWLDAYADGGGASPTRGDSRGTRPATRQPPRQEELPHDDDVPF